MMISCIYDSSAQVIDTFVSVRACVCACVCVCMHSFNLLPLIYIYIYIYIYMGGGGGRLRQGRNCIYDPLSDAFSGRYWVRFSAPAPTGLRPLHLTNI